MYKFILVIVLCLGFSACVNLPDVYLIDRHTVMESESSGEWPELEQRLIENKVSAAPVPYQKDKNQKTTEAHILLNSELSQAN